jgi:hypothetical protein
MSSAVQERNGGFSELADYELSIGQAVTVLQTKREQSITSSSLGELVCEVSTIEGTVAALPHQDKSGKIINTIHLDQGEGQPTYVFHRDPVSIVESCGMTAVRRQIHFDIIPMNKLAEIS